MHETNKEYLCPVCRTPCEVVNDEPKFGNYAYCPSGQHHHPGIFVQFPLAAWPPYLIREVKAKWRPRDSERLVEEWLLPKNNVTASWIAQARTDDIVRMLRELAEEAGKGGVSDMRATYLEAARFVETLK